MALVDNPFIFVIGSPRSGTSWLQAMLGSHPEIVTSQESHLFSNYLAYLWHAWEESLDTELRRENRHIGLANYLSQNDFDDIMRYFIRSVYSKLEGSKPGARFILEKTPAHTLHLDLISYYLPTARYIHLVRDGRDVAVSLMASSRTWGRSWAPRRIDEAASTWKKYVMAGRKGRNLGDRYIEVYYEELLKNGFGELNRLFEFLDIQCSPDEVARIYNAHCFENVAKKGCESGAFVRGGEVSKRVGDRLSEPDGFYRKGIAGDWKNSLKWWDVQVFARIAGDLLVELGYEHVPVCRGGDLPVKAYKFCHKVVRGWRRLVKKGRSPQ